MNSIPVASGGGGALLETGGEAHTPEEKGADRERDQVPEGTLHMRRRRWREKEKSRPRVHCGHSPHLDRDRHHKQRQSPTRVKRESVEHPPAHRNQKRSPLPRTRLARNSDMFRLEGSPPVTEQL